MGHTTPLRCRGGGGRRARTAVCRRSAAVRRRRLTAPSCAIFNSPAGGGWALSCWADAHDDVCFTRCRHLRLDAPRPLHATKHRG